MTIIWIISEREGKVFRENIFLSVTLTGWKEKSKLSLSSQSPRGFSRNWAAVMKVCLVFLVLLSLLAFAPAQGKHFMKCELAKELDRIGVPKQWTTNCEKLKNVNWTWMKIKILKFAVICLAIAVSGSNTTKITTKAPNDYLGIYQISNKWYCGKNGQVGGICNIKCEGKSLSCRKLIQLVTCCSLNRTFGRRNCRRYSVCHEDFWANRFQILAKVDSELQITRHQKYQQTFAQSNQLSKVVTTLLNDNLVIQR